MSSDDERPMSSRGQDHDHHRPGPSTTPLILRTIVDVKPLTTLCLRHASLNDHAICAIATAVALQDLMHLDLSHNDLVEFPAAFVHEVHTALWHIDLSFNPNMTLMPVIAVTHPLLGFFSIEGNTRMQPPDVVAGLKGLVCGELFVPAQMFAPIVMDVTLGVLSINGTVAPIPQAPHDRACELHQQKLRRRISGNYYANLLLCTLKDRADLKHTDHPLLLSKQLQVAQKKAASCLLELFWLRWTTPRTHAATKVALGHCGEIVCASAPAGRLYAGAQPSDYPPMHLTEWKLIASHGKLVEVDMKVILQFLYAAECFQLMPLSGSLTAVVGILGHGARFATSSSDAQSPEQADSIEKAAAACRAIGNSMWSWPKYALHYFLDSFQHVCKCPSQPMQLDCVPLAIAFEMYCARDAVILSQSASFLALITQQRDSNFQREVSDVQQNFEKNVARERMVESKKLRDILFTSKHPVQVSEKRPLSRSSVGQLETSCRIDVSKSSEAVLQTPEDPPVSLDDVSFQHRDFLPSHPSRLQRIGAHLSTAAAGQNRALLVGRTAGSMQVEQKRCRSATLNDNSTSVLNVQEMTLDVSSLQIDGDCAPGSSPWYCRDFVPYRSVSRERARSIKEGSQQRHTSPHKARDTFVTFLKGKGHLHMLPRSTERLVQSAIDEDYTECEDLEDEFRRLNAVNAGRYRSPLDGTGCTTDELRRAEKTIQPRNYRVHELLRAIRTMLGPHAVACGGEVYNVFVAACCVVAKDLDVDFNNATLSEACRVAAIAASERGFAICEDAVGSEEPLNKSSAAEVHLLPPAVDVSIRTTPKGQDIVARKGSSSRVSSAHSNVVNVPLSRPSSRTMAQVRAESASVRSASAQLHACAQAQSESIHGQSHDTSPLRELHPFMEEAQNTLLRHRLRAQLSATCTSQENPAEARLRRKSCSGSLLNVRHRSSSDAHPHGFIPLAVREHIKKRPHSAVWFAQSVSGTKKPLDNSTPGSL